MMAMKRLIYFISDGTGITAETLGHSLLSQFTGNGFELITLPYIDTVAKAEETVAEINQANASNTQQAIVFSSIVNPEIRNTLSTANAKNLDLFEYFLPVLSETLEQEPNQLVGQSHAINSNMYSYTHRMKAVHYALENDDGQHLKDYNNADIILVGVSRCGKTPTCLYLALHFGVHAANYPITEDDMTNNNLPPALQAQRNKLYALTIDSERLSSIRNERRANSTYASFEQCDYEVRFVESMMKKARIPTLNSTQLSIEEISARIMKDTGLKRHSS
jgi:regulator of PEP synthase PpsR (kinase-PPPase family)